MGIIDEGLKMLVPPSDESSVRHILGWRWVVFMSIFMLMANAAGGRGWIPFIPAYAQAADVKVILELQYASTIQNLRDQMCSLPPNQRAQIRNVLEEYQRRYRELTGDRYPILPCTA